MNVTSQVKQAQREELRAWLRRYRTARARKLDLDRRLHTVRAELHDPPIGGGCGQGAGGHSTPSVGAAAIAYRIDEAEQKIKDQQGRMAQIMLETAELIDLLPDGEEKRLLEKRYIDCLSWRQLEKDLHSVRSALAAREVKALDALLDKDQVQQTLAKWRKEAPNANY